jgi:ribosome-associated protein
VILLAPGVQIGDDELSYQASRAGGPGGQNVNKVATRIELFFDLAHSPSLAGPLRGRLLVALSSHLDSKGVLRLVASEARSQSRNREAALRRLKELVTLALRPRRRRIRTTPTPASKERRLREKRHRAEAKARRRDGSSG